MRKTVLRARLFLWVPDATRQPTLSAVTSNLNPGMALAATVTGWLQRLWVRR